MRVWDWLKGLFSRRVRISEAMVRELYRRQEEDERDQKKRDRERCSERRWSLRTARATKLWKAESRNAAFERMGMASFRMWVNSLVLPEPFEEGEARDLFLITPVNERELGERIGLVRGNELFVDSPLAHEPERSYWIHLRDVCSGAQFLTLNEALCILVQDREALPRKSGWNLTGSVLVRGDVAPILVRKHDGTFELLVPRENKIAGKASA